MIRMKAIRSFGFPGSNEGHITHGKEFTVASPARAQDLEAGGLAFRLEDRAPAPAPAPVQNKAAVAGPLASAGGKTGAAAAPSSSAPVRPQAKRTSRPPRGKRTSFR